MEPSHGPRDRGYSSGGGYGGGYGADRYDDRGYGAYRDEPRRGGPGPSPYGPSRKTDFQCIVSNLEPRMSWQDLKDHFREYRLEVTHADVRTPLLPAAPVGGSLQRLFAAMEMHTR